MKRSLLYLLAAPTLVAFSERGQGIAFAPSEGLVLTKSFLQTDSSSLTDMSLSINGSEQDASMAQMEQEVQNTVEVVIVDEYGPLSGGRPARLKRSFEKISSHTDMTMTVAAMPEPTEMSSVGESELEGEVVLFKWDDEQGEYVRSFAEDNGSDVALLDGLTEDTDLRGVLPTEEVEAGATWEVDADVLIGVMAFCGDLKLDVETETSGGLEGMGGSNTMPSPGDFLSDLDGTVTAEFTGMRDEDGVRVAVIQLTVSVTAANDMTEFVKETAADAELPEGMEMSYNSVDIEFTFEGEGLVLWDVGAGHLRSFEMSGDVTTLIDSDVSMSVGGRDDMNVQSAMTMEGSQTIKLTAE